MTEVVRLRQGHLGVFFAQRWLAAALGQLGRTAEANDALDKTITASPDCSNCLHTIDRLGTDLKITPTSLTGYARLGGEADGGLREVWGTRGPVRELYHPPPSPDPGNCDEETLRRIRRSDGR